MGKNWSWPSFIIGLLIGTMFLSEQSSFGDYARSIFTGLARGANVVWVDYQKQQQTGQKGEEPLAQ